jgi:phosphoribosylglycinamide formyltransferase-1
MRLLSPVFIDAFPNAILNIHPALLPAFPGLDAQHQAWAHGVKVSGATVHLVNRDLDAGPIVLQRPVPVPDDAGLAVCRSSKRSTALPEPSALPPAGRSTAAGS